VAKAIGWADWRCWIGFAPTAIPPPTLPMTLWQVRTGPLRAEAVCGRVENK
jgi:hypothetical protein